jgi:hypothetical protein
VTSLYLPNSAAGSDASVIYMGGLEGDVMAEWQRRTNAARYQTDPVAWLWDILGKKWWSKQEEIAWSFVNNEFTIVKSANGVGKTQLAGDLVTWWVSVFPPSETIALVSAPVRNQIDENLFNYLRSNYHRAMSLGRPLVGEITRWPKWVVHEPYDKDIVLPKRPADSNLLSSFQGVHQMNVAVVLDEAGGLQEDFYIGANAVTTNDHARILAIGNPDMRNTAFHERFKSAGEVALVADPDFVPTEEQMRDGDYFVSDGHLYEDLDKHRHWKRYTISTRDLPTHTGEVVFPDDPERDAELKKLLTKPEWTKMMERSASAGVVAAKVNGEFPGEDDDTFFSQIVINRAWNAFSELRDRYAKMDPAEHSAIKKTLGCDVAFKGKDKNVVQLNVGGLITRIDKWGKEEGEDAVEHEAIADRIHRHAIALGVDEVRVDASGAGSGVYSILKTGVKYTERTYVLIGIIGANASPNKNAWLNARAWHYDEFRRRMAIGEVGIDPADKDLRTDLEAQTYKYTLRKQLQITSKEELLKDKKHSPDDLDAAIYSDIDMSAFVDDPTLGLHKGDVVLEDPFEMAGIDPRAMPI